MTKHTCTKHNIFPLQNEVRGDIKSCKNMKFINVQNCCTINVTTTKLVQ